MSFSWGRGGDTPLDPLALAQQAPREHDRTGVRGAGGCLTATVHHGIDLDRFTFAPIPEDYLLFLGRIHPDKGTHLAVEVARRSRVPLVIAGIVQDDAYFREVVAPHVNGVDAS